MEAALLRLWSDIKTIGIGDIVDIVVIAYLVYRILTVVRRTSAGSVIKGVALLAAMLWLSNVTEELDVINYFLTQVMKMGVIIVVVLFQPELRRVLEQFGSRDLKFLSGRRTGTGNSETIIEVIVSACCDMAKTKTGVLIVFERGIGLNDYVASGTTMSATVTAELLKTIFFPNTPLHDGAALVRDGRLLAAGCMLPMTSNQMLPRDLGMRHKAGIGISERSDAVAVIVSEETGAISVAIDGMLKRHLERDTFYSLLCKELLEDTQKKKTPEVKNRRVSK